MQSFSDLQVASQNSAHGRKLWLKVHPQQHCCHCASYKCSDCLPAAEYWIPSWRCLHPHPLRTYASGQALQNMLYMHPLSFPWKLADSLLRKLMPTSASSKCSGGSPHRRAISLQNPQHLGTGGCRVMLPQPGRAGVLLAERCRSPLLELLLVEPA